MKKYIFGILILFILACTPTETNSIQVLPLTQCNVMDDNKYKLMEAYFDSEQMLTHDVVIHYFINGAQDSFSNTYLRNRIDVASGYFKNFDRQFGVIDIIRYTDTPEDIPHLREKIEQAEAFHGRKIKSMREKFYIEYFDTWHKILKVDGAINLYVYDGVQSGFAGVALKIGTDCVALRWDFMDVIDGTVEHELGHAIGLRHTHEKDHTYGFNREYGDLCSDTASTEMDLSKYMDDDGNYIGHGKLRNVSKECQQIVLTNFMAYNDKKFRKSFSIDQGKRAKFFLENSQDLRATVRELKGVEISIPSADLIL